MYKTVNLAQQAQNLKRYLSKCHGKDPDSMYHAHFRFPKIGNFYNFYYSLNGLRQAEEELKKVFLAEDPNYTTLNSSKTHVLTDPYTPFKRVNAIPAEGQTHIM